MQQPKLNVDISKSTPILNSSGGKLFHQGYILRKISKFVIGGEEDAIVPIQIYYDPETLEICRESIPPGFEFLFKDEK